MAIPARRMSSMPISASSLAIQIVQAAVKPSATVNELIALCQNDAGLAARVLAYGEQPDFPRPGTAASPASNTPWRCSAFAARATSR